jgi:hypothetical protein
MTDVQTIIADLKAKGWTLAAIADEVGVTWFTVKRWETGEQYPDTPKPVLMMLDSLLKRKRIPKQRRYAKGSRTKGS